MPVTYMAHKDGLQGSDGDYTRQYYALGASTESAVQTDITTNTPFPTTELGVSYYNFTFDEQLSEKCFLITVRYYSDEDSEDTSVNDNYSFDTGNGSYIRYISIETTPHGDVPTTGKKLINCDKDGVPQGVQLPDTAQSTIWTINKNYKADEISFSDIQTLWENKLSVNSTTWGTTNTVAAECALFLGATGSYDGNIWQIGYQAALGSHTTENIGTIGAVTKKAHDYFEAIYEKTEDEIKKKLLEDIIGVKIHQVYPKIDFSFLPEPLE